MNTPPTLLRLSRVATLITIVVLAWPVNLPLPLPNFDTATLPWPYLAPMVSLAEIAVLVAIVSYALAGWQEPRPSAAVCDPAELRGASQQAGLRSRPVRGAGARWAGCFGDWLVLRSSWRRLFALSLAGLIVFATISIAWSPHHGLAAVQVMHVLSWAGFAVMISCACWSSASMAFALLVGLMIHCVVGIAQIAIQPVVGIAPQNSGISVVFNGAEHWQRVYGVSPHPNLLGGHLAVGVILILGLIVIAQGRQRFWLIAAWLLCWLALLLTFSRSAWLGVIGGGVMALLLLLRGGHIHRRANRWSFTLAGASLMLIVGFAAWFQPFLANRLDVALDPYETQAIAERLTSARLAVQIFAAHPLIGVGLSQSVVVTRDLLGAPIDWIHNVPLLAAAELGLGGLVPIGLLVIALIAIGLQRWRLRSISLWQALVGGGLIALSIALQFDHYVWTAPQGGLLWAWLVGWWLRDDHTTLS